MVRLAVFETLLYVAVIVTAVSRSTVDASTLNVALVAPAATVTLELLNRAISEWLLESVTTAPPDEAAAVSVTVPCDRP